MPPRSATFAHGKSPPGKHQVPFSSKVSPFLFVQADSEVLGIESLIVPLPDQPTYFSVTLDNGIDYIRTPHTELSDGAKVNQEFALVEHPNFEFSLSLDIRRDPHILKLLHEGQTPQLVASTSTSSPVKAGFRGMFASPRKAKTASRSTTPIQPARSDSITKYLATASSSTIAKTHVAFKPIAKQCEARVLEIRYPMFSMFKGEPDRPTSSGASSHSGRKQLAKVTLQIFRLPPLPGLKSEDLPQCIDDCLRGIRHHAWHEHEYHEGILTQEGGDCTVRRYASSHAMLTCSTLVVECSSSLGAL